MIIGLKNARFENGQRYAVAVRRSRPGGGAIVVALDAAELVQFRRQVGIGKLIKDLGTTNDVEYVVLQDREGIVAASGGVEEMSSIVSDSVLTIGLERDTILARIAQFRGHEVYEVVRRLNIDGSPVGILRIAMSMDEIRTNEARMSRRFIVMTLVLLTMGILLISAILFGKRYRRTFQRYAAIRTTTDMILENMQDAVITLDDSDRIIFFNRQAEQMFGMPVASVVGRAVSELEVPAAACFRNIFTQSQEDAVIECAEGRSRSVSISLSTVINDAGVLEHRTAVIKDLTEIKRMESDRKRQEKLAAMGELAAGVAHEIRNPLNAIGMIIQRMEREFVPRSGAKEYRSLADVLKKETARVNSIVQQFLIFARPPKLNISAIDAEQFAEHFVHLFDSQARSKEIAFSSRGSSSLSLQIDQEQMTQALLNLLQNALEATPAGGNISLSIGRDENEIIFIIADSGSGIAPEQLERIFNLYYTTRSNGTGMGLAITQQIVSRHGGAILVTSTIQHGSVFTIRIPIRPLTAEADLAS
ncbi:MAG: ATP-binding protein [Ignavibacteriales bacterium]|nr:ATP-binding protein [Ignavibacteriales bacterium]